MDLIDSARLSAKCIACTVSGDAWPDHPLAREPDRVDVSETGRPTFYYANPRCAYSVLDDEWLIETRVRGSVVEHAIYSASGRVVARNRTLIGDSRWN